MPGRWMEFSDQSDPVTRRARFRRINVKATGLSAMKLLSIHGI
jgi:hypothetical protein